MGWGLKRKSRYPNTYPSESVCNAGKKYRARRCSRYIYLSCLRRIFFRIIYVRTVLDRITTSAGRARDVSEIRSPPPTVCHIFYLYSFARAAVRGDLSWSSAELTRVLAPTDLSASPTTRTCSVVPMRGLGWQTLISRHKQGAQPSLLSPRNEHSPPCPPPTHTFWRERVKTHSVQNWAQWLKPTRPCVYSNTARTRFFIEKRWTQTNTIVFRVNKTSDSDIVPWENFSVLRTVSDRQCRRARVKRETAVMEVARIMYLVSFSLYALGIIFYFNFISLIFFMFFLDLNKNYDYYYYYYWSRLFNILCIFFFFYRL